MADFKEIRKKSSMKRKGIRANYKRVWYRNDKYYIVHIKSKNKAGVWDKESFRAFTRDGGPGYKYTRTALSTPEGFDSFCKAHALTGVMKCDDSTRPDADKVYQWAEFPVTDFEIIQGANGIRAAVTFYNIAIGEEVTFEGSSAVRERIARDLFYKDFNIAYPGCTLDDDDEVNEMGEDE